MTIETTPTSELLAELRRREQIETYSVEPCAGPRPGGPLHYAIYRNGEVKQSTRGPVMAYTAICRREDDAIDISGFLNERAARRRHAHSG